MWTGSPRRPPRLASPTSQRTFSDFLERASVLYLLWFYLGLTAEGSWLRAQVKIAFEAELEVVEHMRHTSAGNPKRSLATYLPKVLGKSENAAGIVPWCTDYREREFQRSERGQSKLSCDGFRTQLLHATG